MPEDPPENTAGGAQHVSMPRKSLPQVESTFIREEILDRTFALEKDRRYIADIVSIEEYVLNPPGGFGGGVHFGQLRKRYPEALNRIQRELDPESYAERTKRDRKQESSGRSSETTDRREKLEAYRRQWQTVSEMSDQEEKR